MYVSKLNIKSTFILATFLSLTSWSYPTIAASRYDQVHQRMSAVLPMNKAMSFECAMRKLWEDHITYTRNYIISALAGLEDASKVAERLFENQDEIGNAIKPYYGDEAGKKLSELLREHIKIAAEIVAAAKDGKKNEIDSGEKKWSANGNDIAEFLSKANPHWAKKDLVDMLQIHLDLTTDEVVSRLKKDWEADIAAYDKGHRHMLMFADALSAGIEKQFPKKFK